MLVVAAREEIHFLKLHGIFIFHSFPTLLANALGIDSCEKKNEWKTLKSQVSLLSHMLYTCYVCKPLIHINLLQLRVYTCFANRCDIGNLSYCWTYDMTYRNIDWKNRIEWNNFIHILFTPSISGLSHTWLIRPFPSHCHCHARNNGNTIKQTNKKAQRKRKDNNVTIAIILKMI